MTEEQLPYNYQTATIFHSHFKSRLPSDHMHIGQNNDDNYK